MGLPSHHLQQVLQLGTDRPQKKKEPDLHSLWRRGETVFPGMPHRFKPPLDKKSPFWPGQGTSLWLDCAEQVAHEWTSPFLLGHQEWQDDLNGHFSLHYYQTPEAHPLGCLQLLYLGLNCQEITEKQLDSTCVRLKQDSYQEGTYCASASSMFSTIGQTGSFLGKTPQPRELVCLWEVNINSLSSAFSVSRCDHLCFSAC